MSYEIQDRATTMFLELSRGEEKPWHCRHNTRSAKRKKNFALRVTGTDQEIIVNIAHPFLASGWSDKSGLGVAGEQLRTSGRDGHSIWRGKWQLDVPQPGPCQRLLVTVNCLHLEM